MAITGTQLYTKAKSKLYPISTASSVISHATTTKDDVSVEDDLRTLFNAIDDLTGDKEAVSNIQFEVEYLRWTSDKKDEVIEAQGWSPVFTLPNGEYPYTWKKTVISAFSNSSTFYEIIAADVAEKIQTIYKAMGTTGVPDISYPKIKDEHGNEIDDLTVYDDQLPAGWTEEPQTISPATPYSYIAVRKRINGLWGRFSNPAQYGRWAFDSQLEIRYQVSDTKPEVSSTFGDPGKEWLSEAPAEFTGKLWMITATSVNGVINEDPETKIKWRGPTLMAIVS